MNMIVIGCGRVGAELAYRLFKNGHRVSVIDMIEETFANLPHDFRGRTIEGEALNIDVLHRAGIETADGLAVVTDSDSTNATVSYLARITYGISNVVSRNYDPALRDLYDDFGLQVISSSSWGAQRLEEMLYHTEMRTLCSAGNGEVEVYEFAVPASWAGKRMEELVSGDQCNPVSVTRNGRAFLSNCDTELQESDVVQVSATLEGIQGLRKRLYDSPEQKGG